VLNGWACITLGLLVVALAVTACDQQPQRSKDKYKFVEFIRLEGVCFETHVRQDAQYRGELVHWHNLTKDQHMRYGSVHHWEELAATLQRIETPHKYFPPFTIEFSGLTAEQIAGDTLSLNGISQHLEPGPRYEATCRLNVVERLDHFPPAAKR
jgi:hypothetical protein